MTQCEMAKRPCQSLLTQPLFLYHGWRRLKMRDRTGNREPLRTGEKLSSGEGLSGMWEEGLAIECKWRAHPVRMRSPSSTNGRLRQHKWESEERAGWAAAEDREDAAEGAAGVESE